MNLDFKIEEVGLIKTALRHILLQKLEKEDDCKRLISYIEEKEKKRSKGGKAEPVT